MHKENGFSNLFILTAIIILTSLIIQLTSSLHLLSKGLVFIKLPLIKNNEIISPNKLKNYSSFAAKKDILLQNSNNQIYVIKLDSDYRINEPVIHKASSKMRTFLWRNFLLEGEELACMHKINTNECIFHDLKVNSIYYSNIDNLNIMNNLIFLNRNEVSAFGVNGNLRIVNNLVFDNSLEDSLETNLYIIAAFNDLEINYIDFLNLHTSKYLLLFSHKGKVEIKKPINFNVCSQSEFKKSNMPKSDNSLYLQIIAKKIIINEKEYHNDNFFPCNLKLEDKWLRSNKLVGFLRKE